MAEQTLRHEVENGKGQEDESMGWLKFMERVGSWTYSLQSQVELLQGHKEYSRLFPLLYPLMQSFENQLDELYEVIDRDVGRIEIFCDTRGPQIEKAQIKRDEGDHLECGQTPDETKADSRLVALDIFFESLLDPFMIMSGMFRDAQDIDADIMFSLFEDPLDFLRQRLAYLAEVVKRDVGTISLRIREADMAIKEAFLDGQSFRKLPQEEDQPVSSAPGQSPAEEARQSLEETKGKSILSFVKMLADTNADDKMIGEVCRNIALQ